MSESLPVSQLSNEHIKEGNAFQTLHGCHIHNLDCLKTKFKLMPIQEFTFMSNTNVLHTKASK